MNFTDVYHFVCIAQQKKPLPFQQKYHACPHDVDVHLLFCFDLDVYAICFIFHVLHGFLYKSSLMGMGGRRSPAVTCWASYHWVASSNPLRGKFRH